MKRSKPITTLLLDIGGVLLTDGWTRPYRVQAAKRFNLDLIDLEARHYQAFNTYELGELSLKDYLDLVVFHKERTFTREAFQNFMFARSAPYPKMIDDVRELKAKYGLKICVLSNEGRELNDYRIRKFKLDSFVDCFISSCFVHLRKPDLAMFRLALDVSRAPPEQTVYIENTPMFVEIADSLRIRTILHAEVTSTRKKLASFGLDVHTSTQT